jgi:hypothetical protein
MADHRFDPFEPRVLIRGFVSGAVAPLATGVAGLFMTDESVPRWLVVALFLSGCLYWLGALSGSFTHTGAWPPRPSVMSWSMIRPGDGVGASYPLRLKGGLEGYSNMLAASESCVEARVYFFREAEQGAATETSCQLEDS